jgi:AraC family transcriptional regulator, regulatory protein of adaptative response / methylated-DNA-[protein]-cysteine methyltransferase
MKNFGKRNSRIMKPLLSSPSDYDRIASAITFIRDNVQRQPELAEVAGHVSLSPFHFQRLFQRWAGVSPKKFLQFLTLTSAKNELRASHTLSEAAFAAGLSGTGRLHDLFVTLEGMTPGEYKSAGADLEIRYGLHDSPFGKMLLASTAKGICHLAFTDEPEAAHAELQHLWSRARLLPDPEGTAPLAAKIFDPTGRTSGPLPLLARGTPFQLKVWEALLRLPEGALTTYGHLAAAIGLPKASRAVGTAVGQNPIAFLIPCHRVIRKAGGIGDYRWGPTRKTALLGWEACRRDDEWMNG